MVQQPPYLAGNLSETLIRGPTPGLLFEKVSSVRPSPLYGRVWSSSQPGDSEGFLASTAAAGNNKATGKLEPEILTTERT